MKPQDNNEQVQDMLQAVLDSRGVDSQKTIYYCSKLIEIAEKDQDDGLMGFACYYLAENYYLLNDIENYFKYIIKGLEVQQKAGVWELAARSYNLLAITSMSQGNAPFSIDYYLTGLSCCEKSQNQELAGVINLNIGALFIQYDEYERALLYIKKSIDIFENEEAGEEVRKNLAAAYDMLSNCYLGLDLLEETMESRKALAQLKIQGDNMLEISERILDIRLAEKLGNSRIVETKLEQLMELLNKEFPFLDIFDELYELCKLLLNMEKYEKLQLVLERLDYLVQQTQIIYLQLQILTIRIQYYEKTGQEKEFLRAAGSYYRLRQRQEKERKYLTGAMLDMRLSMEQMAKKQRQVEAENRELQRKSEMDALTGLPNRFKLNDYSEETFEYAYATRTGFGIEILDVDYFKEYNDTYGHAAGDNCLRTVAEILKELAADENIFAARYGGDEFMVVYKNMTKEQIYQAAERMKAALTKARIPHVKSKAADYVTISQGIYYGVPSPGNKVWDFLHAADMALYCVKRESRNDICMDTEIIQALRE